MLNEKQRATKTIVMQHDAVYSSSRLFISKFLFIANRYTIFQEV